MLFEKTKPLRDVYNKKGMYPFIPFVPYLYYKIKKTQNFPISGITGFVPNLYMNLG